MVTFHLTKRQYDSLVTHYPDVMRDVWPKLGKQWHITGVTITGTKPQVDAIRERLSSFERIADILR